MQKRKPKPEIIKKLTESIQPNQYQNMLILGLNVPLSMINGEHMKDRVIVYCNNALIKSREEFDKLLKDVFEYRSKQDKLKAKLMKHIKEISKIDSEIFKILDDSDFV